MPPSPARSMVLDAPALEEDWLPGETVSTEPAEVQATDLVDDMLVEDVRTQWPTVVGLSPEVFEEIAQTTASRTIIVIRREDGVAYSTLFSIFAALLLDAVMLGGLYFLNGIHWSKPATITNAMGVAGSHDSTAIGGMVVSGAGHGVTTSEPLKNWRLAVLPPPPKLPDPSILKPRVSAGSLLAGALDMPEKNLVIGVAQGPNTWQQPQPRAVKSPPLHPVLRPRGPVLPHGAPPSHVRSRGPRSRGPNRPGEGTGTYNLFYKTQGIHPGAGGGGRGRGGWSADRPAEPKKDRFPKLPLKYALARVTIDITVKVLVLPDGRVESVKIIKSSGHPTVDGLFKSAILTQWKFLPARKNNLPIRSYWEERIHLSAD